MSEPIIKINDVNKWFGDFQVLKNINLDVNAKQKIVVCGPSGSGKSTLLNSLLLRKSFYNDMFDNVTIISPTIKNDQTSRFLHEKYKGSCFSIKLKT